jgi:hypothetical protein
MSAASEAVYRHTSKMPKTEIGLRLAFAQLLCGGCFENMTVTFTTERAARLMYGTWKPIVLEMSKELQVKIEMDDATVAFIAHHTEKPMARLRFSWVAAEVS